jgi:hypothetical protein
LEIAPGRHLVKMKLDRGSSGEVTVETLAWGDRTVLAWTAANSRRNARMSLAVAVAAVFGDLAFSANGS